MREPVEARSLRRPDYPTAPFIDGIQAAGEEFLQSTECNGQARELLSRFREGVQQYDDAGRMLIDRALDVAIPWYQLNPDHSMRFRKYVPEGQEKPDPYIVHPLEVGLESMGADIPYDYSALPGYEDFTLPCHHDPYDAVTVAAAVLHDGLEDSPGMEGIGMFKSEEMAKETTLGYLERGAHGRGNAVPRETAEDVWNVVRAVTKPTDEHVTQLEPTILADPFVQMSLTHLAEQLKGRVNLAILTRKLVEEIAFAHTMLERTQGDMVSFIRAVAVKTTDRGRNAPTGMKPAKLHESFSLAVKARILGLPAASALAAGLITNNFSLGADVGSPEVSDDQIKMLTQYRRMEYELRRRKALDDPPQLGIYFEGDTAGHFLPIRANQIPLTTAAERQGSSNKRIDPSVQFLIQVDDKHLLDRMMASQTVSLQYDTSSQVFTGHQMNSRLQAALRRGRQIVYFEAEDQITGNTAFLCRITGDTPTGHDVIKHGSTISAQIPETAIFDGHDGSIESTLNLYRELSPLAS